ncbi:MAG: transcription termination/antitermination protein NusG [Candidatus Neomarinimicrobiota bacterium]|nr:transcription termination/antitermination protein NusG [Candidatus Neomarinimicrobiota bacterium]
MNWYSLRVMSGKEEKIKDSIFRELAYEKEIAENVEDILIPTENVVDIKNGKKHVKKKVFFPGYILLKMEMNNETKFFIEGIDGVMSFVGPKGSPQSLNDAEIKRIVGSFDPDDDSVDEIEEIPFKVGDSVKVTDGPFKDFNGLIQEINDRNRIKVNVNIFGRPTPIELSFNQILIEN